MRIVELVEKAAVGKGEERRIEYTFVFKTLAPLLVLPRHLRSKIKILDVGCGESFLSKVLAELGFDVTGIDIRPFDITPARFIQANVLEIDFGEEVFDIVLCISTVEHIGLDAYNQTVKDPDGDIKTMDKVYRWLKTGGIAIVTVPFGKPHHPPWFERVYNYETLRKRIIRNFELVHQEIWCNFDKEWRRCEGNICLEKDCVALLILRR